MNHYAKWLLSVFLMGIISATALAAGGGGNTEGAPFPVPLSCYSEDAGSEEFLKARCDKIDGIENYRDPEGAGIGGILSHRISANPFQPDWFIDLPVGHSPYFYGQ